MQGRGQEAVSESTPLVSAPWTWGAVRVPLSCGQHTLLPPSFPPSFIHSFFLPSFPLSLFLLPSFLPSFLLSLLGTILLWTRKASTIRYR